MRARACLGGGESERHARPALKSDALRGAQSSVRVGPHRLRPSLGILLVKYIKSTCLKVVWQGERSREGLAKVDVEAGCPDGKETEEVTASMDRAASMERAASMDRMLEEQRRMESKMQLVQFQSMKVLRDQRAEQRQLLEQRELASVLAQSTCQPLRSVSLQRCPAPAGSLSRLGFSYGKGTSSPGDPYRIFGFVAHVSFPGLLRCAHSR